MKYYYKFYTPTETGEHFRMQEIEADNPSDALSKAMIIFKDSDYNDFSFSHIENWDGKDKKTLLIDTSYYVGSFKIFYSKEHNELTITNVDTSGKSIQLVIEPISKKQIIIK